MATGRVPTTANSPLTAKGDLFGYSTTQARVAVGNDGETLVADSSTSTGLRYQGNYAAGKNRIINGAMTIDQRNTASTAVTVNAASNFYATDRWSGFGQATDGVFTLAQDSSAPTGFSKSLKATVTTADASISATQSYSVSQLIEGLNVVDFDYGTASAKTISVSFWVRSSLTGTFGAAIRNSATDRSYVFSYSISAADTWEKKTAVIPGDTTGTWLKDSGIGLRLSFGLGQGTDRVEAAGSWYASSRIGVTGQTQVIGTLNATWYVTGVQVEIGNVATAFQTATGTIQGELAACQRYYYVAASGANTSICMAAAYSANTAYGVLPFKVSMRTAPTVVQTTGTDYYTLVGGNTSDGFDSFGAITNASTESCRLDVFSGITSTQLGAYWFIAASASARLAFNAEL